MARGCITRRGKWPLMYYDTVMRSTNVCMWNFSSPWCLEHLLSVTPVSGPRPRITARPSRRGSRAPDGLSSTHDMWAGDHRSETALLYEIKCLWTARFIKLRTEIKLFVTRSLLRILYIYKYAILPLWPQLLCVCVGFEVQQYPQTGGDFFSVHTVR